MGEIALKGKYCDNNGCLLTPDRRFTDIQPYSFNSFQMSLQLQSQNKIIKSGFALHSTLLNHVALDGCAI